MSSAKARFSKWRSSWTSSPYWLPDVWEAIRESADAIVFNADSQRERIEANEEWAEMLEAFRAAIALARVKWIRVEAWTGGERVTAL